MRDHDEPRDEPEAGDPAVRRPGPARQGHRPGARSGQHRAPTVGREDGLPGRRAAQDRRDEVRIATGQVDDVGVRQGRPRASDLRLSPHRRSRRRRPGPGAGSSATRRSPRARSKASTPWAPTRTAVHAPPPSGRSTIRIALIRGGATPRGLAPAPAGVAGTARRRAGTRRPRAGRSARSRWVVGWPLVRGRDVLHRWRIEPSTRQDAGDALGTGHERGEVGDEEDRQQEPDPDRPDRDRPCP